MAPNHDQRQHAKYSSSRIHRVRGCPGYVAFSAGVPSVENAAALEGTQAHQFLELALMGISVKADCTPEMWRAIEVVLDYVESVAITHPGRLVVMPEEPVTFPQSIVPADQCGGIGDILMYDASEQEGWSVDFKYGHLFVSEKRNPQTLFNAVGKWWHTPIKRLHLVVIQPNCYQGDAVRTDTVGPVEMAEFQMEVEAAIRAAEQPDAPLVAGPHCRWCERELTCPVREQRALAVVDPMLTKVQQLDDLALPAPHEIPADKLAYILRHADELRTFLSAAEKHALTLALSGLTVPDHKLVEATARRQFPDAVAPTAARLSALTQGAIEPTEFTEVVLKGVTKVEAILAEHAALHAPKGSQRQAVRDMKERLAFLTPRQSSGNLTLAHISDSRPAALTKVAAGFAGVSIPLPPAP